MRRVAILAVAAAMAIAVGADGAVFERYLRADNPADQQIMSYLTKERAGTATSLDLTQLGVLLLNKGFPKDAERYLRQALDADKENYEAAYRLGLVLQREGKDRKAVKYYRKVVKVRPGYAYAQFMLGLAEERTGDRDSAIEHYVKAYKHAPELADARVNPLVLDSRLQTEALILRYDAEVRADTFRVTPVDPWEIELMRRVTADRAGEEWRVDEDAQGPPEKPMAPPPEQEAVPAEPAQEPPPPAP